MAGAVTKNMIVRVGGDFSGLINNSKKGSKAVEEFSDRTKKSFKSINGRGGGGGGSGSGNGTLGIFGKASGLLKAAAVIGAITPMIKKAVSAASDLQEVQNVVDVSFGGLAAKANDFAQNQAELYGLSELQAKSFSGNYMAMAKSIGVAGDTAADMSIELTKLSGDVASFFNLKQDEAYTKLRSVFTGETEALKALGVQMTQANLEQYALSNGINKSVKDMTAAEKTILRYSFVMSALNDVQGDFGRTSDSWANSIRTLQNRFTTLFSIVGKGFIAIAQPFVNGLNTLLGAVNEFANGVSKVFSSIFGTKETQNHGGIVADTEGIASDVDDALGAISGGADKAADKVIGVGDAAKKAAKALGLMNFDEINKLSENSSSSSSGSSSGNKGGASSGLSAITSAADGSIFDEAAEKTEKFSGALGKLQDWLGNLNFEPAKKGFKTLSDGASELSGVIGGGLQWGLKNVLAPLSKWTIEEWAPRAMEMLGTSLGIVADWMKILSGPAQLVWDTFIKPLSEEMGQRVLDAMDGINEQLKNTKLFLDDVVDVLDGEKTLGDLLKDWLNPKSAFDSFLKFDEMLAKLLNVSKAVTNPLTIPIELGKKNWDTVGGWVVTYTGKAVTFTIGLGKKAWSTVSGWVTERYGPQISAGIGLAKKGWSSIKSWLGTIPAVSVGVKLFKSGWKKLSDFVGSFTKKIGLSVAWDTNVGATKTAIYKTLGLAGWPTLKWNARGAILDGATLFGMAGNTLLGGGEAGREAVLPLDRNTEWMDGVADKVAQRIGGANGRPIEIRTTVTLDGRVVANSVRNVLNHDMITTGSNGLMY